MNSLSQDVRYALRILSKNPGFAAVAVLMLALGIGVNSAIFSFMNGLLLRPYSFPEMECLMTLWESNVKQGKEREDVAPANFLDWKKQNQAFEHLAAFQWWDTHLTASGEAEQLQGFRVTASFFAALRVTPASGRVFDAEAEQPGREDVVVVSHGLWQRRFGGDPELVGRTLRLNGLNHTVMGIMPAGFEFPVTAELWVPLVISGAMSIQRENRFLQTMGRLKPGVTQAQARAEMQAIASRLAQQYPQTNTGRSVNLVSLHERLILDSGTRDPLLIMMAATGFVWLLACANMANLQLARATGRRKELAIRAALGASPGRIARQLLTESVIVGVAAGLVSLLFAVACIHGLKVSLPPDIARYVPGWKTIGLDAWVFAFTLAAAVLAGILFGIAPALLVARPQLNDALKEGVRGTTTETGRHWLRSSLVVVEVSLALVLLVCAGLLLKGFLDLLNTPRGFVSHKLLTMRLTLPSTKYPTDHQVNAFFNQALRELAAIADVKSAAVSSHLPFAHKGWSQRTLRIEGRPPPAPGEALQTAFQTVSTDYFRALQIPLRDGRVFHDADDAEAPRVAVISESLARRHWPNEVFIGKRIQLMDSQGEGPWFTIVGVVGNVKRHWSEPDVDALYCPVQQYPELTMIFALRTQGDPKRIFAAVRTQIQKVDAAQPVANLKTMDQIIAESMAGLRIPAGMLGCLSGLSLVLAAAGIYSVMAYAVTQRTNEIGIRMALGARRVDISRMIVREAMRLVVIGLAVGLPVAFAFSRVMASLMFGLVSVDFAAIAGLMALLAATALLASYLPARRATKVDPLIALRSE